MAFEKATPEDVKMFTEQSDETGEVIKLFRELKLDDPQDFLTMRVGTDQKRITVRSNWLSKLEKRLKAEPALFAQVKIESPKQDKKALILRKVTKEVQA